MTAFEIPTVLTARLRGVTFEHWVHHRPAPPQP